MAYDIIGDIHGQGDKLHALLAHLGYRVTEGAHRHPSRKAIFVGDFIDRGPRQHETVMTVRRMVDAGNALAVMGNHEFNAIAWHTAHPDKPDEYLRTRNAKNRQQHESFLKEAESDPALHKEMVDWFLTLPLWPDLPGIRVVHACWHGDLMEQVRPLLNANLQLNREFVVPASQKGTIEFRAVETLTKGVELRLPEGYSFDDKDGHVRKGVRIRWWDTEATSYRDLVLMPKELRERLPDIAVDGNARPRQDSSKPVFFGHYWMTGDPALQNPTTACVDYSAGNGGPLVAYRWDGELLLDARNFAKVG